MPASRLHRTGRYGPGQSTAGISGIEPAPFARLEHTGAGDDEGGGTQADATQRGKIGDDDVRAVRLAGYDDAQIVEIVLHVALNTWTNYINEVARTEIDFPAVAPSGRAA